MELILNALSLGSIKISKKLQTLPKCEFISVFLFYIAFLNSFINVYFFYESYIFAYLRFHGKNLKILCLWCESIYENSIIIKGERFGKCKYMLTAVCFLNSVIIFKISYIFPVTHFSSAQLLAVFFSTIKNDHLLLYCSR